MLSKVGGGTMFVREIFGICVADTIGFVISSLAETTLSLFTSAATELAKEA
jgi:hypothetical protein